MLSAIIFLPAVGSIIIALFLRSGTAIKRAALVFSAVPLVLALVAFIDAFRRLDLHQPQFVEKFSWVPQLNVQYYLGADGLSLPLVLLTALLGTGAVLISWHIHKREREYFAWLLLLQTSVTGVFASLDLLLFFLFWEIELVPMYFLISIWGYGVEEGGRREYSAMKYVIFTILGSALMLAGILVVYFSTGTFDMVQIASAPIKPVVLTASAVFTLLFLGFAIKLPMFPFHTWLPDAHTDAPTAVSVMLAGVLLKMGGYGMIRIAVNFFPDVAASAAGVLAALAVVNILYGAAVTLRQTDLKRMIAYSSVSHMGYVLLGIAALNQIGLTGASLQMFSHGIITGLLFMMAGLILDKVRERNLSRLGGLATRMPFMAVVFVIAGLAALGLPSMSGFVAEITVFLGTFPVWRVAAILGAFGIVLTAGYMLWMVQRTLFGPPLERFAHVEDAHLIEKVPLAGLVAAIMFVGLFPSVLSSVFSKGVEAIVGKF